MSVVMRTSTPFSSVPRMSAPQAGHSATASRQTGHRGGERFLWRGTIDTLTPGNVSATVVAHRRSFRSASPVGSREPFSPWCSPFAAASTTVTAADDNTGPDQSVRNALQRSAWRACSSRSRQTRGHGSVNRASDRHLACQTIPNIQGRTRRPRDRDNRTPYLPVQAVVRWVVLGGSLNDLPCNPSAIPELVAQHGVRRSYNLVSPQLPAPGAARLHQYGLRRHSSSRPGRLHDLEGQLSIISACGVLLFAVVA